MTTDREIDEILAEIGREHRQIGAPEKLVSVMRTAAGGKKNPIGIPGLSVAWSWAAAMIFLIAVAIAGVIWQTRRSHQSQNQQVLSVPAPQAQPEPMLPSARVTGRQSVPSQRAQSQRVQSQRVQSQSVQSQSVRSQPVKERRHETDRVSLRAASSQPATWNSLDEFVALPVSEGLPPAAELSVIRIKLRGSDLQQYGLEAPADAVARTMLAEFVVGEDGLPRAIRIVR
jgi:hypothetical protein